MSDSKLSELTAASTVGASDLFYIVQSNSSKRIAAANLIAGLTQVKSPPANVKGSSGDSIGMIAFDASNLYICVQSYTTGTDNIWRRITLTAW
jgi:hypothetical protein